MLMRRRDLLAMAATPLAAAATPAPLPVVASFTILADFLREIGGDRLAITSLVGPDADVHVYEPRPADLRALAAARLVVRNGAELEGWLARLVTASGYHGPDITAADGLTLRTLDGGPDPHVWQNPRFAARMVANIAEGLAAADPSAAAAYRKGASAFTARILQADAAQQAAYDAIPPARRKLITSHDAFFYYGARYGIDILAIEGISTEGEPSARAIAALAETIRRENIRTVFLESMASPRLAATLAREAGATVGAAVYSDALSPAAGPAATYLDMQRWNLTHFLGTM